MPSRLDLRVGKITKVEKVCNIYSFYKCLVMQMFLPMYVFVHYHRKNSGSILRNACVACET